MQLEPLRLYLDSVSAIGSDDQDRVKLVTVFRAELQRKEGHPQQAYETLAGIEMGLSGTHQVVQFAHAEHKAYVLGSMGLRSKALDEAYHALSIAEALNETRTMVDISTHVAYLENATGKADKAIQRLIGLERLVASTGMDDLLCEVLLNKGNTLYDQGFLDDANSIYATAADCARTHQLPSVERDALFNIASCHTLLNQYGDAVRIYREALQLPAVESDPQYRADVMAHIARTLSKQGKHDEAIAELREALTILNTSGIKQGAVECHLYLAEAFLDSGQLLDALKSATESASLSRENGDLERMADSEQMLSTILLKMGDPATAIEHLERAKYFGDSLAASRFDENSNLLNVAFETDKKEAEISRKVEEMRVQRIQLLSVILVSGLLVILSVILYRNLRNRKKLALKDRELYEQQMGDVMRQSEIRSLDSLMQGQEIERKRVAKDLHDRLGSMLSAIKLQFSVLEGKLETVRDEGQQQYRHVYGLLDDAVGEVRRISHDMLKSSLAQFGLQGALDDLRQALLAPGKLEVEMSLFGLEERLDQKIEIAVFRMVQECVSNALKHAKASSISIEVTRSAAMLNVIVDDNGKGFDTANVQEGMGLGNLRQRAAEVGGVVQFDSWPGRGTTVTIDVPLA